MNSARVEEINALRSRLSEVEQQINNIVAAVTQGFTQASFLDKMTELEAEKARLEVRIAERKMGESKTVITEEVLRQPFTEFKGFVTNTATVTKKELIGLNKYAV